MLFQQQRIPNDIFHATVLLIGLEDQDFLSLVVDEVEWTDLFYCHQN